MRFYLNLSPVRTLSYIPFNYQYAISALIYKKLAQANEGYAEFLHEKGYAQNQHSRHFKLFTFSNLQGKFSVSKKALKLESNEMGLILTCHMPEFAENLIKGVFTDQHISIGDHTAQSDFTITQIEVLPKFLFDDASEVIPTVRLKLLSPIVMCRKNSRGNDDYLSPEDEDFIPLLIYNLKEKIAVAYGTEAAEEEVFEVFIGGLDNIKSRLVTIKAGKYAETKVRGFLGFEMEMKGSKRVIQLAMDCGCGGMSSLGFGCVEVSL
ncbi:CRISPR-associated endoribonuclease Cas6 [Arcticibacter eurypsychrophilus]|uniref:CRISPR-associated endoribonuclease Cas6 n=1 Tax=Arcticibacter eurypsychrophilus TaxID=1434752 RepID=UPI00084DAA42|nr:CRISPR-associated endoribonuclease Cas6 [Arcticibacter eurypsychrophilus]